MSAWWSAVARLAAFVTCMGWVTSRFGLIAHELVGHGATALLAGGEVTGVRLYYVAGGWVGYRVHGDGGHLVSLGGIGVELIAAMVILLVARGPTFAARVARGGAGALAIHASWYLATGTFHGYGDGIRLYRTLGDTRLAVVTPAALLALVAAYLATRAVFGALAATIAGSPRARVAGTVVALVIAGGIQLGAAIGEVKLRRETRYAQIMRPERDRVTERELAAWIAERERAGAHTDAAARAAKQAELAAERRELPFAPVLAIAIVLAAIAGAFRARPADEMRITSRMLIRVAALAGASIVLVVALGIALGSAFA